MKKAILLAMAILLLAGIFAETASAARIPHMINIQGYLTKNEIPINDNITLSAELASGEAIGDESFINIPIAGSLNVYGVAVDNARGLIWSANANQNSVTKIDPQTNSIIQTVLLGAGTFPHELAVDSSGDVWVASGDGNVRRIRPITGSVVASITAGINPFGIVIDSSDYLRPDGVVWVTNYGSDNVSIIDRGTNTVIGTVSVGDGPRSITIKDGIGGAIPTFGVTNYDSGTVSLIKPDAAGHYTSSVPVSVGTHPNDIATDSGGNFWVANKGSNFVSRITGTGYGATPSVTQVPLSLWNYSSAGSDSIASLAWSMIGFSKSEIWVRGNAPEYYLYRIDPQTSSVIGIAGELPGSNIVHLAYDLTNKTFWGARSDLGPVVRFVNYFGKQRVIVTNGRFSQLFGPFVPTTSSTDSYKINVTAIVFGNPSTTITINNLTVSPTDLPQ